jgi:hypothetical protein
VQKRVREVPKRVLKQAQGLKLMKRVQMVHEVQGLCEIQMVHEVQRVKQA